MKAGENMGIMTTLKKPTAESSPPKGGCAGGSAAPPKPATPQARKNLITEAAADVALFLYHRRLWPRADLRRRAATNLTPTRMPPCRGMPTRPPRSLRCIPWVGDAA